MALLNKFEKFILKQISIMILIKRKIYPNFKGSRIVWKRYYAKKTKIKRESPGWVINCSYIFEKKFLKTNETYSKKKKSTASLRPQENLILKQFFIIKI